MSEPAPRILFAAPNESLISDFYRALPRDRHNVLALNVLDQPAADVIEYARVSSIEVIISRGGVAEFLRTAQRNEPDSIPIVQVQVTPFDIIDAVREAKEISRNIAFIAYQNMLEGIKKITDIFDLDVRFVSRSSPWDCLESIFTALEHKAEVIIGDARVVKMCRENNIPCVLLSAGEESLCQAYQAALEIIEARDNSRRETRRLTTILDMLDQGLIALDGDGCVVYSNAQADALASTGKKQLLGQRVQQIALFQNHLPPSFFLEDSGKTVFFSNENKQQCVVCWKKLESATFGINGILSLTAEHGEPPQSRPRKGHDSRFSFGDIIGSSPALARARTKAQKYAQADATVLLQGQTGVGKELFAHAIHNASPRCNDPFVAVNLAALPATLMESELFGYVRGAFTDARRSGKQGVFEYAGKGTVFLDEIGEIPLQMQLRLLRVLQDGEFMRLGDDKVLKARCRIISGTNKVLEEAVRRGAFREDLYYRLNVLRLSVPSLLERREDIQTLAQHFLGKFCIKYQKNPPKVTQGAIKLLLEQNWKGNIRELQAIMERYVILSEDDNVILDEHGLHDILENQSSADRESRNSRRVLSIEEVWQALEKHDHNIVETASALGIHRTTLWRKLKNMG